MRPSTPPHEIIPVPPPEQASGPARWFASGDPGSILACISSGDPLRLFDLGVRLVRSRYLLIDPERLHEVALAFVAHAAALEGRRDAPESWLLAVIERAIQSILVDDAEEERRLAAPNDPDDPRYQHLSMALVIDPQLARAALVRFNALPERTRHAFVSLLIDAKSVEATLIEGPWEPNELRNDVWEGLRALGHIGQDEDPGPPRKKTGKRVP